ncbi:MAG: phosphonate transporter, periplasmic phosphonate-binding protein [Deltaproteobacteria bacterium]|nr:phosphonate transporter, periplasmic phosphonate-binding protein [Deltaproteobacteria bacterium]
MTILLLCLLCLVSCSSQEPPAPVQKTPRPKLVIGLIPEQNVFRQMERYEPLMAYLGGKTGYRFELKVLPRYGNIVTNFQSLELDGAFFGSFTYALAHTRIQVDVVARPENLKGVSTYHGMVFVRKDSGIASFKDMKGKRMAMVDKATTAGYLLPLAFFRENGNPDFRKHLKEVYFTGTHEDAIRDVVNRKADIGAAKNTVFERMSAEDPGLRGSLKILAVSPQVPENALAMRSSLGKDSIGKIRKALLEMDRDPEGQLVLRDFGARRFIETTDKDYEPVFRFAKQAGIDLSNYEYMND